MRKILTIVFIIICISACSNSEVKQSNEEKYYDEIMKVESNMKKLEYFKMNKVEDKEYIKCIGTDSDIVNTEANAVNFRFSNIDQNLQYISSTKVSDEIQYITQYYRNDKIYTSYSQLPYDISVKDQDAKYVYFDIAISGVDLKFYKIKKEKIDENIKYTITLNKAKEYNDLYKQDYDDESCGLIGDYKAQEIVLLVNKDNYIIEEKISSTINYHDETKSSQKENVTTYQFYDYGVVDPLDFTMIDNFEGV